MTGYSENFVYFLKIFKDADRNWRWLFVVETDDIEFDGLLTLSCILGQ